MLHPLFIYGTLHPDRAPAAISATARLLKPLGRATIQGRLYDLGEYPGVVLGPDIKDTSGDAVQTGDVSGEIFVIPNRSETLEGDAILARLDAYEDFRPADPASSLFLRQLTRATCTDGDSAGTQVTCWIYTYNRPVP